MSRRLVVVLAAIVLIASGCFWDQPGFDATGSNNNSTETAIGVNNVASLHVKWSAAVLPSAVSTITQSDVGLIDVSNGTGVTNGTTLTALDQVTGATAWSRTEPATTGVSGATGDGNNILVTTAGAPSGNPPTTITANLEVRDARTGATVSTTPIAPTGETLPFTPVVSMVTKSGPWAVTSWQAAGITNGGAFEGVGGFQVTNLDDPSLSWHFDGSTANGQIDEYRHPVIEGDRLYLEHAHAPVGFSSEPTSTSTVAAWNLSGCTNQCAPLFETPNPALAATPTGSQDGRAVYAPTAAGFAAYDPATGAQQWEATIAGQIFSAVFATTDNAEVVGTSLGGGGYQLAVFPTACAAAPCAATWTTSFNVDTTDVGTAIVANGVIYATLDPTNGGPTTLVAYPLDCTDGCQPLWTMPTGDQVTTGPIVSNGQVIYGTASGKVVLLTP